ncbi:MAG: tRNA (adenine(58)-N(1))-methyltransferase catalytic subunit TRMT61A, partial [archaeon]|nr:tRNA (adenine(58)-N(1))-methyltransferase catalytic subunit TRMT61A [archaeon]
INYGDLIIVYEKSDSIKYFTLEKGKVLQNKFGSFKHDDIYQKEYGSKIHSTKGNGYITVLSFVPNIWERCINKLTQILYNADISLVMTLLNINKNSIIYESGTGSGCLSVNMISTLSKGHLYTFEFNKERADKLKELFTTLKLNDKVTIIHRDVIENGFEVEQNDLIKNEHKQCDGIFIDLPSPWLAIEKIKKVLKINGRIVTFSPCIEQIEQTVKALNLNGFINVRMFECIYRTYAYAKTIKIKLPDASKKRKFGENLTEKETEINLTKNKCDMRGHTGFLLTATLIEE